MKFRYLSLVLLLCSTFVITGCFVYKIDIQQGNEITEEMVSQLQVGMSKRDVTRLLGYPLINDPFHKDRWDYYYYKKSGKTGDVEQQLASLKFQEDLLTEIKSSFIQQ